MSNPLGNAPQVNNNGNNGGGNMFFQLVKQIQSGQANPQAIVQMLIQNNPQIANKIEQLRGNNGHISYQNLAMMIMREKGIDPNEFMAQFK